MKNNNTSQAAQTTAAHDLSKFSLSGPNHIENSLDESVRVDEEASNFNSNFYHESTNETKHSPPPKEFEDKSQNEKKIRKKLDAICGMPSK